MPFHRAPGRLMTTGYFDLDDLKAVVRDKFGPDIAQSSMGDVQDIFLNILDIIDSLPTVGGGGSGADLLYTAGNGGDSSLNCNVVASALGVTYSVSAGIGTITVPDGVTLKSFTIKGNTSILSSNSFAVQIVFETSDAINSDIDHSYHCVWDVENASTLSTGVPSRGLPILVDKDNLPQKQITLVSGNTLELFVPSLNAFTHWFIVGVFA